MTPSTKAPVRTYGFGTVVNLPYVQTVERTRDALKQQGFAVLTEIDVKATMKAKLGATSTVPPLPFLPFVPEEVPLRIGQQAGSISSGRVFAMSLSSNERP